MDFSNLVDSYKNIINSKLKSIYPEGPDLIKLPIHHILSGGKRFRPILCMLTTDVCKGNSKDAIDIAVAIELLHTFTLIHDDIMDKDVMRHGKKTIHNKWDDSVAILSGDGMLAIALSELNKVQKHKSLIIDRFHSSLIEVCEGQALDLAFQNNNDVSIEEYIEMIDKKTGNIIGLSSEIGAIVADRDSSDQNQLKRYGQLLGRAFQIQDDLLEILSDSKKMGKSLKSDFLLNKKTFISIKARKIHSSYIDDVINIAENDYTKGMDLYKSFLNSNNIIDETKNYIINILKQADSILDEIKVDKEILYKYTNMILKRKF